MATHSSVLSWRFPGTGEPGGLPSMGSQSQTQLKQLSSSSSMNLSLTNYHKLSVLNQHTIFYLNFCESGILELPRWH